MNTVNLEPKVSVIVPVYNVESYLAKCLDTICGQTLKNIEIICVDDGSTDHSYQIVQKYAAKDKRIFAFKQENKGGGAARNYGLTKAHGEFTIFLDSDDYFERDLLEQCVTKAEQHNADIVAFSFTRFTCDGVEKEIPGVRTAWINSANVFSYKDCPDQIMSIVNPIPWNKLYRTNFIIKNNFKFDEITSTNDVTFATITVAAADKIVFLPKALVHYRVGHSNTVSATKTKNLNNIIIAITSSVSQAQQLPHAAMIQSAIQRFAIEKFVFSLRNYVVDFNDKIVREFYSAIHEYLNQPMFNSTTAKSLHDEDLYRYFMILRKQNYEEMQRMISKKLIASFTSYPARINTVYQSIECILQQTHPANKVILYLAEEQFPQRLNDLPQNLIQLINKGQLTVQWCSEDLRSHKKYYYAFQEYKNDLIVTFDDDLLYDKSLLQRLWESYLLYPDAVSAVRTHLITLDLQGNIRPYKDWIMETDGCMYEPSMQLMATTGAGTLHPAELFPPETFYKDVIINTCFNADDLWLKAIEVVSNIPVVCCRVNENLCYIPGSQKETLYNTNVINGQNDVQLSKIGAWMEEYYGEDILNKKLKDESLGVVLQFSDEMIDFYRKAVINARKKGISSCDGIRRENTQLKQEIELLKSYSLSGRLLMHIRTRLSPTWAGKIYRKIKYTILDHSSH